MTEEKTADIGELVKRLENPPFGTETSERNLFAKAGRTLTALEARCAEYKAEIEACCEARDEAGIFPATPSEAIRILTAERDELAALRDRIEREPVAHLMKRTDGQNTVMVAERRQKSSITYWSDAFPVYTLASAPERVEAEPSAWPHGFFKLGGDHRLGECATESCCQHPSIRVEADGVGSDYCEPCAKKIAALASREAT